MIKRWFQKIFIAVASVAFSSSIFAQQADFNEVGRQMAIMLQNSHFAKLPFNSGLSQRFLDDYLSDLDFQRLYFTQEDIDGFAVKYRDQLHTMLLHGESMTAATEIYRVFEKRVDERVALAQELLKREDFEFTTNESVMLSRKDVPWPKNDREASDLWRRQIKEAVLGETLRRELLTKLSKEQSKPDPGLTDRDPKEKVALRYKRFLSSVKDVDEEEIANYFLSSVARAYDPHTDYMSFREMNRFKDGMKNELVGIGALLQGEEDGATKIKGIVVGGPADRDNTLRLNDRVVAVDTLNSGRPDDMADIMFMKIDKVVDLIRGKEDTNVALKVEPAGGPPGETKIVVIKRGKVEMKDEQASAQLIEMNSPKGVTRRLGVLTLPSFYADFEEGKVRCSVDVERILTRLIEEKIDGLVLDLRNNGGGSLEEVRRMTGFFLDSGPVVQVKNTLGQIQVKESDQGKPIYTGPMALITDRSSASASEILAGALQDFNRAVIVGDSSTFGKGTVQQPMDIGRMLPLFAARNRAGFLKVTIQKFYRPSGSSTQMDGVVADVVVPSLTDALEVGEAYMDHPLPHDRIRPASGFAALDPEALFIPRLKELSQERINSSKDFAYVIQDVMKTKNRLKENQLSLNKSEREMDLSESDTLQKQRNAERRVRFSKISEEDKTSLKFYKLTLEDLETGADLRLYNPAEDTGDYMRRAKDETDDLDETPKWPTGLDPVKRESLAVLKDLIDLTENARLAGLLRGAAGTQ
ncbi:MAG: carboxy terminal-processing peptidase [Luteolibacter sp.]